MITPNPSSSPSLFSEKCVSIKINSLHLNQDSSNEYPQE